MARKKKKKQTKTAKEFQRIKKAIRSQERYYQKKGLDTVSVLDTFAGVKPTRSSLAELKRYQKQWKLYIDDVKKEAAKIQKEKDISSSVAYKYLAARDRVPSGGSLLFEDVILKTFIEKVNSFPNFESRQKMGEFIVRMRRLLGDQETARILAETADNEEDFDAVLQYYTNETALQNTYNLMDTIVAHLSETENPIAIDELREFMDTLEF